MILNSIEEYLNSLGCIHRDVAARNVLVDSSNVCKVGINLYCTLHEKVDHEKIYAINIYYKYMIYKLYIINTIFFHN